MVGKQNQRAEACPGGDLLLVGRGSAVPSSGCVCLPVQGAYLESVGVSPDEAII